MEGRPWLRILLILIGFSLLGLPVWSITHSAAAVAPVKAPAESVALPLRVEVTFVSPPTSFDLEYLGAPLLSGHAPERDFATDWKVAIPEEGVDLFVSAEWPAGTPATAVRVRVLRDGNSLADQTFWADESLAETITVRESQP